MNKKTMKETIRTLETRLESYETQVHDLQVMNKALKEKSSTELWSLKEFLESMAENVETVANELLAEPGSLKVEVVPMVNEYDYPLSGYKAVVTADSKGYGDKDLEIFLLRTEVQKLKAMLLQQEADRCCGDDPTN